MNFKLKHLNNLKMKIFKVLLYIILVAIELPFIFLTYLDYYWNSFWKFLSNFAIIFMLPAIITMPISWLDALVLSTITYLQNKILGRKITYAQAVDISLSRFPEP
jgi:hypothetical protein